MNESEDMDCFFILQQLLTSNGVGLFKQKTSELTTIDKDFQNETIDKLGWNKDPKITSALSAEQENLILRLITA